MRLRGWLVWCLVAWTAGAVPVVGDILASEVLSGMPDYPSWHGCAPTSGGMVIGYWDQFPLHSTLYDGDASTWYGAQYPGTYGTAAMVANETYIAAGNTWVNHDPSCIADFMHTVDDDTAPSYVGAGLVDYAAWDDPSTPVSESYTARSDLYYYHGDLNFELLITEIDAGRPMIFNLKAPDKGHALAAYGYRTETGGAQYYAVRDTWQNDLTWAPPGAFIEDGVEWWSWKLWTGSYSGDWDWQVRTGVTFEADPIPEPATVLLFGMGLPAALIMLRRRRRQ